MGVPQQPSLGALEASVLSALWDSGEPLSVREVQARIRREPPLAYTTVLTVLDRLHGKGAVSRVMCGKAYVYRPAMSREAWLGSHAAGVLMADSGAVSQGGGNIVYMLVCDIRPLAHGVTSDFAHPFVLV